MTTLFIIGNGFDIRHELKTSYNDFRTFLEKKDFDFYSKLNEELFYVPGSYENTRIKNLWSKLEENVGINDNYYEENLRDIIEKIEDKQKEAGRNNPVGRNQTEVANNDESLEWQKDYYMNLAEKELFENNFAKTNKEFLEYLKEFIASVNQKLLNKTKVNKDKTIKKILEDNPDAKFVTFNYTSTLERIYGIKPNKILYVHGKEESDGKLIFGNRSENINEVTNRFIKTIDESDEDRIIQHDTETHPDVNRINPKKNINHYNEIKKEWIKTTNLGEFNSFVNDDKINKIIILGHSMGIVDEVYFKMLNSLHPNKQWIIYLRNKQSKDKTSSTKKNFYKLFPNCEVNYKFCYYNN